MGDWTLQDWIVRSLQGVAMLLTVVTVAALIDRELDKWKR